MFVTHSAEAEIRRSRGDSLCEGKAAISSESDQTMSAVTREVRSLIRKGDYSDQRRKPVLYKVIFV